MSPILFLFYNADLVKRRITNRGGAVAFINNYTAWVVGRSAEENLTNIKEIVNCDGAGRRRSNSSIATGYSLLDGNYTKISD